MRSIACAGVRRKLAYHVGGALRPSEIRRSTKCSGTGVRSARCGQPRNYHCQTNFTFSDSSRRLFYALERSKQNILTTPRKLFKCLSVRFTIASVMEDDEIRGAVAAIVFNEILEEDDGGLGVGEDDAATLALQLV